MKVILLLFTLSLICHANSIPDLLDRKSLINRFFKPQINSFSFFEAFEDGLKSDNDFNRNNDSDSNFNYVPIMELDYYGGWNATDESLQQFNYFNSKSGKAEFTAMDKDKTRIDDYLIFAFFDGKYVDQKAAFFTFQYNNTLDFHPDNSTFKNSSINFNVTYFNEGKRTDQKPCPGSYQLSFIDSDKKIPYNKTTSKYLFAVAEFWLKSEECKIDVRARVAVSNPDRESKALYYSLLVTFITLGHLYATIQIIKTVSQNEYDGARYSLITLCILTIWDVFMCLFHLYEALSSEDFFHYFITPSFWYFILSSIFETRMILIVWKTKYYNQFINAQEVRRGITSFYLKFYGGMIALLYLGYQFLPSHWFLTITALFFLPQIVHNAIRGQRYKFDANYCFLLGALRIIIPTYVKGCPESLFELTPRYSFVEFYAGLVFSQIIILYLQAKLGARFFIPRCFLPPMFNYYVKIDPNEVGEDGEPELCSICMENLNEVVVSSGTALLPKPKQIKLMVTPCRHKFHPHCLQQWMDLKLECPFCRAPIPPFE